MRIIQQFEDLIENIFLFLTLLASLWTEDKGQEAPKHFSHYRKPAACLQCEKL